MIDQHIDGTGIEEDLRKNSNERNGWKRRSI